MKKKITLLILLFLLILNGAISQVNLDSGLVAKYYFDGNAEDESGHGYNGTVYGATLTTDRFGNLNSAYSFDGVDDRIVVSNFTSLPISNQPRTISVWIYTLPNTWGTDIHTVIHYGDWQPLTAFGIDMSDYPRIQFYTWDNDLYCIADASRTGWIFLTFSYDGKTIKGYINGVLIDKLDLTLQTTLTDLIIGLNEPTEHFLGNIDDIRIYNRALNNLEIISLYHENLCYQTITVTDTLIINAVIEGFNPPTYLNTIKIYPNPTNDKLTIDYGDFSTMSSYSLQISNSSGRIVYTSPIKQQISSVSFSTWAGKGVYFINLLDADNKIIDIRKIVLR
jgi:hypothetical protein